MISENFWMLSMSIVICRIDKSCDSIRIYSFYYLNPFKLLFSAINGSKNKMGKQKECQHHLLSCYLVFNFTTYTSLPVFTRKSHQSRIGCFREGSHSSGGAGWSRGGRRPTVGWPCIILSRNTMGDVIGSSCLCVCRAPRESCWTSRNRITPTASRSWTSP